MQYNIKYGQMKQWVVKMLFLSLKTLDNVFVIINNV